MCVVEASKSMFTNDVFQHRFAEQLAAVAGLDAADAVELELVDGREAYNRLRKKTCDAIIVLGSTRPPQLRRLRATILAASLGADRFHAPFFLVIGERDERTRNMLVAGFPRAVGEMMSRSAGIYAAR